MKKQSLFSLVVLALVAAGLSSCSSEKSNVTGWNYNDPEWGGFEVRPYEGQITGPNLVFIEGGTFVMGQTEENVVYNYNATPRRVTVRSFYMDQTEIRNVDYREYLYWLERVFSGEYPQIVKNALPDTLVWREELAYNEPYVDYYLRHPAYNNYPVVGVSWLQANEFCKWRTDRVNEMLLIEKGILNHQETPTNEDNFNTEAYLVGVYTGNVNKNLKDLDPSGTGERPVEFEDGILLPDYRLPTEAEWEYAALALLGNQPYGDEERITDRRIYPWDGSTVRYPKGGGWQGKIVANFMRGRGDYMGLGGNLNDNAEITAPVDAFLPNDYGLYNMAGNVNEWVADVYRPLTFYDADDLNPYRGNVFKQPDPGADEKWTVDDIDSMGRLKYTSQEADDLVDRRNYKESDVIDHWDGDELSEASYNYGVTSLISDKARVYKGGSWADRAYWLSPGTRRFLDEDKSSAMVGFRCAMDRVGSPSGNNMKGGNQFKRGK